MGRKKRLFLVGLPALVVVATGLVFTVYRVTAAWSPTIKIVNGSGQKLEKLRCSLFAGGATWTETVGELNPGESVQFRKRVSDLYVASLEFDLRGLHHESPGGGIATPGETLLLTVSTNGTVSESYDSRSFP